MENKNNKNNKSGSPKDGNFNIFNLMVIGLICTVIIQLVIGNLGGSTRVEISFNAFLDLIHGGYVQRVEVQSDRYLISLREDVDMESVEQIIGTEEADYEAEGESGNVLFPIPGIPRPRPAPNREGEIIYYTGALHFPEMVELLYAQDIEFIRHAVDQGFLMPFITNWVLPIAFFYLIFSLIMRNMSKRMGGGGIMGVGKSNAKLYNLEKATGITFNDVAGQEEAKESLSEIIDYLHNPEKYVAIGAKQPRGALLVGPPGTGKTLLAKAVAGEAKVPFFSLTGSEFVEMYVGVGASRVRDLFKQANTNAPCIIFIDEIDAVGKSRDNQYGTNDEREQTLNQLLSEMDGFDTSKGLVVLAATNRPESLDKALLRPGRFDRRVIVEKPDLIGREAILKVHAKKVQLDDDVDLKRIAMATSGAAGADLANMINEGALRAVRENRKKVKQEDLMEAVEVVMAGKEKKDRVLTKKEKRIVAFHEIGHALTMALQKNTIPVQKITIVPRTMGSLGYVMYVPEEETYLTTKEEIVSRIVSALGGRAAEDIEFNTATTGAFNDIERATAMARSMVSQFGMSEHFGVMGLESVESRYLDGRPVATCAPETEAIRDREVKKILDECYAKAKNLLLENRLVMETLADHLFEKENITGDEFLELLKENKPDFVVKKDEEKDTEAKVKGEDLVD
ncbi:MAG: ATP-dependent zinc metalloprotease FtsH [Defluviitaleaceae bacterium]|nr:ATP-dependent zinc metalloprotease FtsH [Defluviitaleaceae bacterium]